MQNNSSMRLKTSKITYSETAPTTALLKTSQYLKNNIHKTGKLVDFSTSAPRRQSDHQSQDSSLSVLPHKDRM